MKRVTEDSYMSPECKAMEIISEFVLCTSGDNEDLKVEQTPDWGWEE